MEQSVSSGSPTARKRPQRKKAAAISPVRRRGATALSKPRTEPSADEDLPLLASYQRDICDLEMALTRLRESNVHLETALVEARAEGGSFTELFEASSTAYLIVDEHGFMQEINRQAAKLLGLKSRHAQGTALARFVSKHDMRILLEHLRKCRTTRQLAISEVSLRPGNDGLVSVQLITVPLEAGPGCGTHFRMTLIDTTERHAFEAALTQTQQNYQRLVDAIEGIVWEADAGTFDVTFVSGYAERLLGYSLEHWHRPGFWENHIHVKDRERVTNLVARAIAQRQDLMLEYRVITADRRQIWLHDRVTVAEQGGRLKLLGVAVDITQRKETEEQLQRSQAVLENTVLERTAQLRDAVGELEAFSYSLAHDMRAPLRAMQGYSQVLLTNFGSKLGDIGQDYLQRMMTSAERLDALIQDVLKYSRVSRAPVELKAVNLEKLVDAIIRDYPTLQEPQAEIEIQKPLLTVYGHEAFLGQCVSNLLTNAVKFTPPGQRPHVRIWTQPTNDTVQVWIEDNGIGIAPEDQQRIFGIFQRVHPKEQYEGTGIGLAIVQKAVERMGGRVGVESQVGHGSRFWLQLQRAAS